MAMVSGSGDQQINEGSSRGYVIVKGVLRLKFVRPMNANSLRKLYHPR